MHLGYGERGKIRLSPRRIRNGGAAELVSRWQTLPHTLGDLDIGGADIIALGAKGKMIGEILGRLLDAVIAAPERNRKDILTELAKAEIMKIQESEDK